MPRLIAIALLLLSSPALAEPQVTILLPTPEAASLPGSGPRYQDIGSARSAMPGMPIERAADSLYASDVALHVLDALQGPLPINREYVLAARQARTPLSIVLIVNVDQLFREVGAKDGAELLALEESEMRAVLELYGVGGADTAVYHDSAYPRRATPTMAGDRAQLAADLAAIDGDMRAEEALQPARAVAGEAYLLAEAEAPGHAVRIKRTATLDLWISGATVPAEITVDGVANPADVARFEARTEEVMSAAPGTRLLLLSSGHVVGVGVVTEIIEP